MVPKIDSNIYGFCRDLLSVLSVPILVKFSSFLLWTMTAETLHISTKAIPHPCHTMTKSEEKNQGMGKQFGARVHHAMLFQS